MVVLRKRGAVRLELSPETPETHAVAVTVTPVSQAHIDVAMGAIMNGVGKMEDSEVFLARYGIETGAHAVEALRMSVRVGEAMLAIELGARHITAWDGVMVETDTLDDAGEKVLAPATLDVAGIAMLFNEWAPATLKDGKPEPRESYGARFMRRINALSTLEPGTKKGSGASPVGVTAEAPITAGGAVS